MQKTINIFLKIVLSLILIMPILGVLGVFPQPTADMYKTKESYDFVMALYSSGYIMWTMGVVFALCLILILKNKMALVSLLLLPITLNILGFHMFLDGGLFNAGAIMADVLFALNLYFLYQNRDQYKALL